MARLATATIVGRLGNTPELVYLGDGSTVLAHLSLAVDAGKDDAEWFSVTAWNNEARILIERLAVAKGDLVLAHGRLRQRRWRDRNTNEPRSKVELSASTVQLLRRSAANEQAGQDRHATDQPPTQNHAQRRTRTDPRRQPQPQPQPPQEPDHTNPDAPAWHDWQDGPPDGPPPDAYGEPPF